MPDRGLVHFLVGNILSSSSHMIEYVEPLTLRRGLGTIALLSWSIDRVWCGGVLGGGSTGGGQTDLDFGGTEEEGTAPTRGHLIVLWRSAVG